MDATQGETAALIEGWRTLSDDQRLAILLPPLSAACLEDLLAPALTCGVSTVLLGRSRSGADVQHLDVLLQVAEVRLGLELGNTKIVAMIGDNPHGLLAAGSFAGKSRRLMALGWDASLLGAAFGLAAEAESDVAASARATLLLAAAAAGVAAIDTKTEGHDPAGFRAACLHARAQGFGGKMTGQPSQIETIESVFGDR